MCRDTKEVILKLLCLVCIAIGLVLAIIVLHKNSLDCVERTCLSMMSLLGGLGVGMLLIWLFSDECGCLGISPTDWFDNLTSSLDIRQQRSNNNYSTNQSYGGFRQSYYNSKNVHESARQREERSIQKLIAEIEEIAK